MSSRSGIPRAVSALFDSLHNTKELIEAGLDRHMRARIFGQQMNTSVLPFLSPVTPSFWPPGSSGSFESSPLADQATPGRFPLETF